MSVRNALKAIQNRITPMWQRQLIGRIIWLMAKIKLV